MVIVQLTVGLPSKDRKIGAMVKALDVEVAGLKSQEEIQRKGWLQQGSIYMPVP